MVIYLYGPDSYRRKEKEKEIISKYKEKHLSVTVDKFELESEDDFLSFKNFLKNQSLFDVFKMAVVYPVTTRSSKSSSGNGVYPSAEAEYDKRDLIEILKNNSQSNNVILISAGEDLPKEFNFLLEPPVLCQEFNPPTPSQLENFIKQEAQKRKIAVSGAVINGLIKNNNDLWGVVNDLNKLELGGSLDENPFIPHFFVLLNRVKRRDLAALELLLKDHDPAKIFNILASQARDSKKQLADYDAAIKSGKLGYEEALLDLMINGR